MRERSERPSLAAVRRAAGEDFPEPESAELIELYLGELAHLMDPTSPEQASEEDARHQATCAATGEDPVTLLCKLEEYLESVLVGRWARRPGS